MELGRKQQAATYASLFRRAAETFDSLQPGDDWESIKPLYEQYDHCGRIVVEIIKRGLLNDPAIEVLAAWHLASNTHDPKPGEGGVHVVRQRCPVNLWLDIVGGHFVHVERLSDGQYRIVTNEETGTPRVGGILTAHFPALLRLPQHQRCAEICRILAQVLENPPHEAPSASATDRARWEFARPLREKTPPVKWRIIAELYQRETGEPVDEESMRQSCYRAKKIS